MEAIMYMVKTGRQWRMLSRDFPPYNTVFYYLNNGNHLGDIKCVTEGQSGKKV
jgi:transposase